MDSLDGLRPFAHDPSGGMVEKMMDLHGQGWIVTAPGDYDSAAVEGFRRDGSGFQQLVAVEWPGRVMHSDEHVRVKLLMHPDDALGLARVVAQSARWIKANPPPPPGAGKTEEP